MERRLNEGPRRPVNLTVKLKYRGVHEFIDGYATNVSENGLFIRTPEPKPPGTTMHFKIELASGIRVLQGSATVRWVRTPAEGGGPPGMGLEVGELDAASAALMQRLLAAADRHHQAVEQRAAPPPVAPVRPVSAAPAVPAIAPARATSGSAPVTIRIDDAPEDLPEPEVDAELDALMAAASRPPGSKH